MSDIFLPANRLYILSGAPASGKSSFLKSLEISNDCIISSDELRVQIMGTTVEVDNDGVLREHLDQSVNRTVFDILKEMLKTRMSNGLTTFVDATSPTDRDRTEYAKIAQMFGMEVTVLIFNVDKDILHQRNNNRLRKVPSDALDRILNKMQYKSRYDYLVVDPNAHYVIQYKEIPHTAIDVMGDVHGLMDQFLLLIGQNGYYVEDGIIKHPENRKLLMLGDVVDRGPKSVELLSLIMKSVRENGHYMIMGNHDWKIFKYFQRQKEGETIKLSQANSETVASLMKLEHWKRNQLLDFIGSLPHYYTCGNFAFVHADLMRFDPKRINREAALYGMSDHGKFDTDAAYQNSFNLGNNKYTLIRGHIGNTSVHPNVISLEHGGWENGELTLLPLDQLISVMESDHISPQAAKEKVLKTQKTNFDYYEELKSRGLISKLVSLELQNMVYSATSSDGTLKIYKYAKNVFWDNLWNHDAALLKARGIVMDAIGNIVQHPFDKIFNYGENDAGKNISDDEVVIAVEKLNGFLGCITKHPYRDELLITTSGSFDSDFVDYIKSFVTSTLEAKLLDYFQSNNITLMFEVIHPDDPHIIQYTPEQHGLYLIGARGKNETDSILSEQELDEIGRILKISRPAWELMSFGRVRQLVNSGMIEGYMIRDRNTNVTICKFKTKYYLTTKFVGRLNKTLIHKMFSNPDEFKKNVDEEFYPVIDEIILVTNALDFAQMEAYQRVEFVRTIIDKILK